MTLESLRELEATREKLHGLEQQYEATAASVDLVPQVRELTLRSLRKLINQLKDEIVRFEGCVRADGR